MFRGWIPRLVFLTAFCLPVVLTAEEQSNTADGLVDNATTSTASTSTGTTSDGTTSDDCVVTTWNDCSGDPPSAPTISLGDRTETSAQINFSSNGDGSDPISSYSVSCEIPAIAPSQSLKRTETRSIALGSSTQQKLQRSNTDGENVAVGRIYSPSPQLNGAVVGDLLEFEAPSGAKEQGLIIRAEVTRFGNYLVHAKSDESEMLAVVVEDGNFISRVSGPSGVFQSQIVEGNSVVYSEADGELVDNPFINDMLVHDLAGSQSQDIDPAELSANPTVISVGIQYDNATRDAYNEIALAEYYVYVANESYQASDVDIRFEIVDTRNYEPYISNSTLGETLRYITCGTTTCSPVASYNSNVKAWRDQVKADLVVQLVRYGVTSGQGTQCGVGWTPSTAADFLQYLPQLTYSVNAIESRTGNACGDIVVAHEMGHNFGLFHDRETDAGSTGSPYYSYAHGHKVNSVYGTVMSYSPVYVLALSNPNKTFNGSPIGVPIGQSGEAFAAQAVANVMSIHEGIYDNTTAIYHTVTASAGNGGSISPSSASVLEGNTTSFAVTPNSDYSISSVTGCNGSLSGSTYTTSAITAPCTVTASFQRYRWTDSTCVSGSTWCSNPASVTLNGLPTGYQFTCRGYATNLAGDSALSSPISFTTQAPTVPSRPNILKTDFGDGEIYLYVSSSSNGGSAITGYTATCTDGTNTFTGTSTSSPITVSGLTNGAAYTCTVTATNSIGTSPVSAVTPPIVPNEVFRGLPVWLLYEAMRSVSTPVTPPVPSCHSAGNVVCSDIDLFFPADGGVRRVTVPIGKVLALEFTMPAEPAQIQWVPTSQQNPYDSTLYGWVSDQPAGLTINGQQLQGISSCARSGMEGDIKLNGVTTWQSTCQVESGGVYFMNWTSCSSNFPGCVSSPDGTGDTYIYAKSGQY